MHIVIRPSAKLAMVLMVTHALAATAFFATPMLRSNGMSVLCLIVLSLAYHLMRDVFLIRPTSWREVAFATGGATVVLHSGSRLSGRVAAGTVVTPYFIVLGIYAQGRILPVFRIVLRDALGRGEFRSLSVRLRFTLGTAVKAR